MRSFSPYSTTRLSFKTRKNFKKAFKNVPNALDEDNLYFLSNEPDVIFQVFYFKRDRKASGKLSARELS